MSDLSVEFISDYLHRCKAAHNYDGSRPLFSGNTVSFLLVAIGQLLDEVEELKMEFKEQT